MSNRMLKLVVRMSKHLQYCSSCLNFLHNYFDGPTKLFSDVSKFLNTSAKLFFAGSYVFLKIVQCK